MQFQERRYYTIVHLPCSEIKRRSDLILTMESMIKYSPPILLTIQNFKRRCILQEEEIPLIVKDQIVYLNILQYSQPSITPPKIYKLRLYLGLLRIRKKASQSLVKLDLTIILSLNF